MSLEATLKRLKRALLAKDISRLDYDFEVSLAKKFAALYGTGDPILDRGSRKDVGPNAGEIELEVTRILHQTAKAMLVETEEFEKKRWYPKSRCRLEGTRLFIPQWLYNKLLEEADEKPKES